jgi:hypothetical protein
MALVRDHLAKRVFLVPWLPREPIGAERLRELAEGHHAAVVISSGVC